MKPIIIDGTVIEISNSTVEHHKTTFSMVRIKDNDDNIHVFRNLHCLSAVSPKIQIGSKFKGCYTTANKEDYALAVVKDGNHVTRIHNIQSLGIKISFYLGLIISIMLTYISPYFLIGIIPFFSIPALVFFRTRKVDEITKEYYDKFCEEAGSGLSRVIHH